MQKGERCRPRVDTRRRRHGRLLGGKHGGGLWQWSAGSGKWVKNRYWRAERRYYRRLARLVLELGYHEGIELPRVPAGSLLTCLSEVRWKGW